MNWFEVENRRDFLFKAGRVVVSGLALEAFFTACDTDTKDAPTYQDYQTAVTKIEDPIIMSTVLIHIPEGTGHGAIYRSQSGDYTLVTVKHLEAQKGEETLITIPGVNNNHPFKYIPNWHLVAGTNATYSTSDVGVEHDAIVRSFFPSNVNDVVTEAIRQKKITPLVTSPYQLLKNGDHIGIPDPRNNTVSILSYTGYDKMNNLLTFQIVSGETCLGFSGLPALRLNKRGGITNSVFGVLVETDVNSRTLCGDRLDGNFASFIPFANGVGSIRPTRRLA